LFQFAFDKTVNLIVQRFFAAGAETDCDLVGRGANPFQQFYGLVPCVAGGLGRRVDYGLHGVIDSFLIDFWFGKMCLLLPLCDPPLSAAVTLNFRIVAILPSSSLLTGVVARSARGRFTRNAFPLFLRLRSCAEPVWTMARFLSVALAPLPRNGLGKAANRDMLTAA
jgi:hypothetical protein